MGEDDKISEFRIVGQAVYRLEIKTGNQGKCSPLFSSTVKWD